jgi:hypothetical protein
VLQFTSDRKTLFVPNPGYQRRGPKRKRVRIKKGKQGQVEFNGELYQYFVKGQL